MYPVGSYYKNISLRNLQNVKYNLKVIHPGCVSNIIRNSINYDPSKHNFILQG